MARSRIVGSSLRQTVIKLSIEGRRELSREVEEIGNLNKAYLDDVVSDWRNKPSFRVLTVLKPTAIGYSIIAVGEGAEIWDYVDLGTEPHIIRSKTPGKPLTFRTGYSAKTAPVARAHVGTGKSSGGWVRTYQVNHPGNEGRFFSREWLKDNKTEWQRRMENAMRRAVRRLK